MTVKEVFAFLDRLYPLDTALDFDNAGFLVGDENSEVSGIVVALDCTEYALNEAVKRGANLIVTHHPVIFEPLKTLKKESVVFKLIENGISLISMHTNFDVAKGGVNDILANKLCLQNIETVLSQDGFSFRKGTLEKEMTTKEFADFVKKKINPHIKYTGNGLIKTVAVCSGAGNSEVDLAMKTADAFVSSEIKHSNFVKASFLGYTLIDAGHFETEDIAVETLSNQLKTVFCKDKVYEDRTSVIKY